MKDQDIVLSALIGDYLEPGPKDPVANINRLIKVLDNHDLAAAIEWMKKGMA